MIYFPWPELAAYRLHRKLFFDELGSRFCAKSSFENIGILCVLRCFQNEELAQKIRTNRKRRVFEVASKCWEHGLSYPTLLGFFPFSIAALANERSCVFTAAGTYRNYTCLANRVDLIALLCRFHFTSLPRCCPGRAITGSRGSTSRQPGQQKLRQLPKELPQPFFRVKDHRSPYLQTPVWFTSFKQFS